MYKRRHIFASAIDSGGSPKLRRDPHIYNRYGDGGPQNYGVMGTGVPKSTGSPKLYDTGIGNESRYVAR